jgi:tyrosyl-tRNA synthetase
MSGPSSETRSEVERQLEILREGAELFVGEEELRARLVTAIEENRPLRVKLGMDPSAPDLHLGHTITLDKLRRFQELGHTPIFLVGDFTAAIGDPTGRKKTRPALDPQQIRANAETYVSQVSGILDVERAEIRYNSEWMDRMLPADFVRLCSQYTVARMLERDDFAKRYAAGEAISVHEFLYPLIQAFDSVALHADVELGGTDQTFNLLVGREIQRAHGQPPQAVMTHPLLVGTDGTEKMSKSLGNTVGITEAPEEIYGKIMSISDASMVGYVKVLGFGGWKDLVPRAAQVAAGDGGDPLALKQELARRLVERFHGAEAASRAGDHFRRVIQERQVPDQVPEVALDLGPEGERGLLEVLRLALDLASTGEARRLVVQGAVRIDGEPVREPTLRLGAGSYLLKAGKRRFARVRLS